MDETWHLLKGAKDEYGAFAEVEFLRLRQILDSETSDMDHVFWWLWENAHKVNVEPLECELKRSLEREPVDGSIFGEYVEREKTTIAPASDMKDYRGFLAALASLIERGAGKPKPALPLEGKDPPHEGRPEQQATVNERMAATIAKRPGAKAWSIRQWQSHLNCSAGAVAKAPVWLGIMAARKREELDRLKRQKGAGEG
jgi:hypothetical protein